MTLRLRRKQKGWISARVNRSLRRPTRRRKTLSRLGCRGALATVDCKRRAASVRAASLGADVVASNRVCISVKWARVNSSEWLCSDNEVTICVAS
eukprot:scaffold41203_cov199-Amphora_coffeaeformis.AAC.2